MFVSARSRTVDHIAVSEQVLVEHRILSHVIGALRETIGWKYQGDDLTRKIESLQFVGQSLQRHLKHLTSLEEDDGYMSVVLDTHPELTAEVEALRQEHDYFHKELKRLLAKMRSVKSIDRLALGEISENFSALLNKLDEHSHKETGLIQFALLKEEGGEG
jgi:hypothetical protein